VLIYFLLYEDVLGQTQHSYECKKQIDKKSCTVSSHRYANSLLEDSASQFYIVHEKVDHIKNVVFDVVCLASSAILNKITVKSMNRNIWISFLVRCSLHKCRCYI